MLFASRPPFPSGVMDCILGRDLNNGALYLSGVEAATNPYLLQQNEIQAILTVGTEMSNLKFDLQHKLIQLHDTNHDPIKKHFEEAIRYIEEQRKSGRNVLVHCYVGVSRSATLVIAYLMQAYNYTMNQAMNLLLQRRPLINPNPGFLQQLQLFDQELMRKRITQFRPASTEHLEPKKSFQRALTINQSPLRKVNQLHNSTVRKPLMLTPSSVRLLEEQKVLTPAQHRMSLTQEAFKNKDRVLRSSNQMFHSAKKSDCTSQKNATAFCRSYANTPNQFQVLLKTAGSGLANAKIARQQPVRVTQK